MFEYVLYGFIFTAVALVTGFVLAYPSGRGREDDLSRRVRALAGGAGRAGRGGQDGPAGSGGYGGRGGRGSQRQLLERARDEGDRRRGRQRFRLAAGRFSRIGRDMAARTVERLLAGRRLSEALGRRLRRAGLSLRVGEFVTLALACAVALAAIGGSLASSLLVAMVAGGLGLAAPFLFLGRREAARVRAFNQQLPDALGIVANSLRSGYSVLQAMAVVAREMPAPIATEFEQVVREVRVNIPLDQALAHLLERVDSADLDLVVTAVLIQRQVGGNLAEVLDRITATIRDRVRILGEIRTLTTQGRISGWVVAALPVGLGAIIFVLDSSYILLLFNHPLGLAMIGTAVVMQLLGFWAIRKVVNVEV